MNCVVALREIGKPSRRVEPVAEDRGDNQLSDGRLNLWYELSFGCCAGAEIWFKTSSVALSCIIAVS